MALHVTLGGSEPGNRTANLAIAAAAYNGHGAMESVYQKLSRLMCWDAMLLCAWAARGINCASVNLTAGSFNVVLNSGLDYERVFGDTPLIWHAVDPLWNL